MSTIDDLLAESLLLHQPYVPSDVVPYNDLAEDDTLLWDGYRPEVGDDSAAQGLAALCEAVVTHCTADQLADFLTDQVPQPQAAWILGCALQLAGADVGARFWWQYAAGADDIPASYCLYLQHRAQGDPHAAALWRAQATSYAPHDEDPDREEDAPAYRMMTADASLTTVLRILSHLTRATPRQHTPAAQAVIEFVAAAVASGYDHHPDLEIPVPGQHFAEQLEIVIAAMSSIRGHTRPTDPRPAAPAGELPNRFPLDKAGKRGPVPTTVQDPEHLLVQVSGADHELASARVLFKGAAAICWKKATAVGNPDGHGNRMAYRLLRFAQKFSPVPSGFGDIRGALPIGAPPESFHR